MKLTANATAALKTIWTSRTAAGVTNRRTSYRITRKQAADAGYQWMNANTWSSLLDKGLARRMVTLDEIEGHRVQVLVLTDLGRAQIGV